MTAPEKCLTCQRPLSVEELESPGSGYCHICGHQHYASLTEKYRSVGHWLAKSCGFASFTTAYEFWLLHQREIRDENGSGRHEVSGRQDP